jgi:hypothetical protein
VAPPGPATVRETPPPRADTSVGLCLVEARPTRADPHFSSLQISLAHPPATGAVAVPSGSAAGPFPRSWPPPADVAR